MGGWKLSLALNPQFGQACGESQALLEEVRGVRVSFGGSEENFKQEGGIYHISVPGCIEKDELILGEA